MVERRWPWLLSAACMLVAAGAFGVSTYLAWLPCQGSMLTLSQLSLLGSNADFTPACLELMDTFDFFTGPTDPGLRVPGASEAAVIGLVLLAAAWLPIVLTFVQRRRWRLPALLPTLLGWALAGCTVAELTGMESADQLPIGPLAILLEISSVAAFFLVVAVAALDRPPEVARVFLVAWAAGSAGLMHLMVDYTTMSWFSEANWDIPPGSGYLTAGWTACSALLVVALTLTRRPPVAPTPEAPELVSQAA